jgi:hypothetical protein
MSKKVLYVLALSFIGILLFCASVFVYTTDAVASLEKFERVMRMKQMFYDSIGYKLK